jgi:hypothetical protein
VWLKRVVGARISGSLISLGAAAALATTVVTGTPAPLLEAALELLGIRIERIEGEE